MFKTEKGGVMRFMDFKIIKKVSILLMALFILGGIYTSDCKAEELTGNVSFIVKLSHGLTPKEQIGVISENGGTLISSIQALRLYVIDVQSEDLATVIQKYQNDPRVVSIEENKTRKIEAITSDLYYTKEQWHFQR